MFLNVGFDNLPPDYRAQMSSFDHDGDPNHHHTPGRKNASRIVVIIVTIIIVAVVRTIFDAKIAPKILKGNSESKDFTCESNSRPKDFTFESSSESKDFTFENMTITLTSQFKTVAVPKEARESGVQYALITPDETMCFIGTMDGFDNMTYDEAIGKLDEVINRNQTYTQKMVRHQKDGLTYYTAEQYIEGAMYSHYAFCFFYEGKMWTAEFYTKYENIDKYEKLFVKWAKSVEFETD